MRPSSEALLISSLVNSGDPEQAARLGVTPEMFVGFGPEYRWLLSHYSTYRACPSKDVLLHRFPSFPYTDSIDIEFSVDEVRYSHTKRELAKVVANAAHFLSEGDLDEALMSISGFTPPGAGVALTNSLTGGFLENYDAPNHSLPVPWRTLGSVTEGLTKGDLWYIAARLGQGKSWTLGCFARDALMAGKNVTIYSLEMPERQVQTRMHVLLGNSIGEKVDHKEMRTRRWPKSKYAYLLSRIKEKVPGNLYVVDSSRTQISPAIISAQADQSDLILVDYAGLLKAPNGNRAVDDWRQMAAISNMLKETAIHRDVPIVAAAQINRDGDDSRSWKPPQVKHLSQSDALGQDADVVVTHKQYGTGAMVYSVEKNRNGDSGVKFFTKFQPNTGTFGEISREAADVIRERNED